MKNHLHAWMLSLALLVPAGVLAAEEGYLSMGIGVERNSGNYGTTTTTESTSIPLHVLYERQDWSLKLSVPYLFVTGDGSVIVGSGHGGRRSTTTTTTTARTTRSGFGDVVATATYRLLASEDGSSGLEAGARAKFGTADKTFGTGMNDYALQLSAYTSLGDLSPNILLGYEAPGSSSELPLDNVAYGAVGASYAFSAQTRAGAEYWYMQRASATGFEQRELSFYASTQVGEETWLRGYVMRGLSDGSPDSGYGVSLSTGF